MMAARLFEDTVISPGLRLCHVPTRGRPTSAYAERMQQSILRVAETLFLRDGYDLVTMEAIAAATKVSKGTLYARYPGKRDLYLAVMTAKLGKLEHGFDAVLPKAFATFGDWFEAFSVAMLAALTTPDLVAFERLLGAQARRFPKLVSDFHRGAYLASAATNTRAIQGAATHFAVSVVDPAFLGEALRSLLWGWARMAPPGGPPIAAIGPRAAQLLLGGAGMVPDDPPRSR